MVLEPSTQLSPPAMRCCDDGHSGTLPVREQASAREKGSSYNICSLCIHRAQCTCSSSMSVSCIKTITTRCSCAIREEGRDYNELNIKGGGWPLAHVNWLRVDHLCAYQHPITATSAVRWHDTRQLGCRVPASTPGTTSHVELLQPTSLAGSDAEHATACPGKHTI
jgi:hypothetical protein